MTGTIISHYRILEEVGRGGMGIVYKAQDLRLNRMVAIKFLPDQSLSQDQLLRFENEARAISSLNHRNIATIHEIDTFEDKRFIVFEFLPGGTLKAKIKNSQQLEIPDALTIAEQIAAGLAFAHTRSVIHRDIKSENIMFAEDGTVKITDFGLSKITNQSLHTTVGTIAGTIAYMSPEQIQGGEVNNQTDIWSLSVILYEMLTGRLPFENDLQATLMYLILTTNPTKPSDLRADISPEIEDLVMIGLDKDPARRFSDAESFLTDLKRIHGGDMPSQKRIAVNPTAWLLSRNTLPKWVLVAAVLAGVSVGVWKITSIPKTYGSLAVLPLANENRDQVIDYLSDGLTENLHRGLRRIKELKLLPLSRTSEFKGQTPTVEEIDDRLGVPVFLAGGVEKIGNEVFLRVSLVNRDNDVLWEKTYRGMFGEIFEFEDDILSNIVSHLNPRWSIDGKSGRGYYASDDVRAYDAYLRGIYHSKLYNKDDNTLAMEYFSESIGYDSSYVPALVALAESRVTQYESGWDLQGMLLEKAEAGCRLVLGIDSSNSQAIAALATISILRGDQEEGVRLYESSLKSDPLNSTALTRLAIIYLFDLRNPAKAVKLLRTVYELDERNTIVLSNLAVAYGQMKNYPEAIRMLRSSLAIDHTDDLAWGNLGYLYERIGNYDSASIAYRLAVRNNPRESMNYENLAIMLLGRHKYSEAESVLTSGIKFLQADHHLIYFLGVTHLWIGDSVRGKRKLREGMLLLQSKIKDNPGVGIYHADYGLFKARLGEAQQAVEAANSAYRLDSLNNEVIMKITKIFSILGRAGEMIDWFKKAKAMNPEYDATYVSASPDFERFRDDPELLAIARRD